MSAENVLDVARCWNCGYSLRGLASYRCPECGRVFDPGDLDSMRIPGRAPRWLGDLFAFPREILSLISRPLKPHLGRWYAMPMVATALVALMPLRRLNAQDNGLIWLFSFVPGWILWLIVLGRSFRAIWQLRLRLRGALIVRCAMWCVAPLMLLMPLSWSVGWNTCPHASYVYFCPFEWIWVIDGTPCSNPRVSRTIWDRMFGWQGLRSDGDYWK